MIVLYNLKFVVMCSGASMKVLDLVLASHGFGSCLTQI